MVERLIVFVVCCGCVVVQVVVQMKTVEFRRSCIPEVHRQMKVKDVFDVEGKDLVIGVVIGVVRGVVLVVEFEVVLVVVEVVAVVPVDLVVVVAVEVPLETGAAVAEIKLFH